MPLDACKKDLIALHEEFQIIFMNFRVYFLPNPLEKIRFDWYA